MKIQYVKCANAVKVGNTEQMFFRNEHYDIELDGHFIRITDKRNKQYIYTSLFNTPYWLPESDPKKQTTQTKQTRTTKK